MISIPTIQLLSMDVAYPSLHMIRSIIRLTLSYSESMKLSRNRHTEITRIFRTLCAKLSSISSGLNLTCYNEG